MRLLVTLFLLCSACTYPAAREVPTTPPIDSVVALVDEYGESYCSGTLVPQGVLTANHCVDSVSWAEVALYRDFDRRTGYWSTSHSAAVIKRSEGEDLALLRFVTNVQAFVAQAQPQIGATVFSVGHPLGMPYTMHRGIVASFPRNWDDAPRHWFQVDTGIIYGMSGGPVFDERGEVVGVHSFMLVSRGLPFPHLGGVVATGAIREFLEGS